MAQRESTCMIFLLVKDPVKKIYLLVNTDEGVLVFKTIQSFFTNQILILIMAQQKLRTVATVLNQLSEALPSETLLKIVSSSVEPQVPLPAGSPAPPIVSNDKPFSIGEEAILLRGIAEGLSLSDIVQKYLKNRSKKSCKKALIIINNRVERNNTWSHEEDVRLQKAVVETRLKFWEKIAENVGGGRTWLECSSRMAMTTMINDYEGSTSSDNVPNRP